jgi:CRISPR-associated protein Csd1
MILQSLSSYYERLAADPKIGIAAPGYAERRVGFALVVSAGGDLTDVQDLREIEGRKTVGRAMLLPTHEAAEKRTVRIAPFFLWDKTAYVLGADDESKVKSEAERDKRRRRNRQTFEAFRAFQHELGNGIDDAGMQAVLRFVDACPADPVPDLPYWAEMAGANVVFRLDGDTGFIHERPAVREAWSRRAADPGAEAEGLCLVSGERRPIARLHPNIKGVWGAQSSGAALSSFNLDAFTSYGKEQNHNAPVSSTAAFAYTTALNHLLRRESRQRLQIGDASTVFWAERPSPVETLLADLLGEARPADDAEPSEDSALVQRTRAVLEAIRQGRHPPELGEAGVPFYLLGLGPNASRLVVRFWHVGTVGELAANLGQHFADLELERQYPNDPEFPGMWRLLIQLTPQRAGQKARSDDIPSPLAAALMRALLTGADYPAGLYSSVLGRLRADHSLTYLRMALLKARLVRHARKSNQPTEVTVSLNEQCIEAGYLLGRLFAVMEKAQRDALGNINATIKDRFYGAASATPGVVFPHLLAKAQHHISKAEYGQTDDRYIAGILELLKVEEGRPGFPPHLNSTQQGLFALGYYHQRNALYRRRSADDGTPTESHGAEA